MSIYKIMYGKDKIGEFVADNDMDARRNITDSYGGNPKIKDIILRSEESTELPNFMRY